MSHISPKPCDNCACEPIYIEPRCKGYIFGGSCSVVWGFYLTDQYGIPYSEPIEVRVEEYTLDDIFVKVISTEKNGYINIRNLPLKKYKLFYKCKPNGNFIVEEYTVISNVCPITIDAAIRRKYITKYTFESGICGRHIYENMLNKGFLTALVVYNGYDSSGQCGFSEVTIDGTNIMPDDPPGFPGHQTFRGPYSVGEFCIDYDFFNSNFLCNTDESNNDLLPTAPCVHYSNIQLDNLIQEADCALEPPIPSFGIDFFNPTQELINWYNSTKIWIYRNTLVGNPYYQPAKHKEVSFPLGDKINVTAKTHCGDVISQDFRTPCWTQTSQAIASIPDAPFYEREAQVTLDFQFNNDSYRDSIHIRKESFSGFSGGTFFCPTNSDCKFEKHFDLGTATSYLYVENTTLTGSNPKPYIIKEYTVLYKLTGSIIMNSNIFGNIGSVYVSICPISASGYITKQINGPVSTTQISLNDTPFEISTINLSWIASRSIYHAGTTFDPIGAGNYCKMSIPTYFTYASNLPDQAEVDRINNLNRWNCGGIIEWWLTRTTPYNYKVGPLGAIEYPCSNNWYLNVAGTSDTGPLMKFYKQGSFAII